MSCGIVYFDPSSCGRTTIFELSAFLWIHHYRSILALDLFIVQPSPSLFPLCPPFICPYICLLFTLHSSQFWLLCRLSSSPVASSISKSIGTLSVSSSSSTSSGQQTCTWRHVLATETADGHHIDHITREHAGNSSLGQYLVQGGSVYHRAQTPPPPCVVQAPNRLPSIGGAQLCPHQVSTRQKEPPPPHQTNRGHTKLPCARHVISSLSQPSLSTMRRLIRVQSAAPALCHDTGANHKF